MPYSLTLQKFLPAEVFLEPPPSWERRLREVSPIVERLPHLRFRFFEPHHTWAFPERGIWALYSCVPKAAVPKDRAELYDKHWSELRSGEDEAQNRMTGAAVARKSTVSSYQHYMWHVYGVDVKPFWFLMGEAGGSPAKYTRMEERCLDAVGMPSEAPPIGMLPACPFDERAVAAIVARDRLYQESTGLELADELRAEDDAAEREYRKRFLDWWYAQTAPQAEFMKSYLRKKEADNTLRRATASEADAIAQFRENWIEFGQVPNAVVAGSRAVQVAVK